MLANQAPPLTVDEFMSSEWGRRYTREEAEVRVERANKAAGFVDPDSTVSAQREELLDLCNNTRPTTSGSSDQNGVQSYLTAEVRRIAPPEEFLQRGKELIGTMGRPCLRWPGQPSFCKLVGQFLGGPSAAGGWQWLKEDRAARAIVAHRFIGTYGVTFTETIKGYVEGRDQLLDPNWPERWGLLQAVASELYAHTVQAENKLCDQAKRDYHLGACWAWCRLPPALAQHNHATSPLTPGVCGGQGRVGRRQLGRRGVGGSAVVCHHHRHQHDVQYHALLDHLR